VTFANERRESMPLTYSKNQSPFISNLNQYESIGKMYNSYENPQTAERSPICREKRKTISNSPDKGNSKDKRRSLLSDEVLKACIKNTYDSRNMHPVSKSPVSKALGGPQDGFKSFKSSNNIFENIQKFYKSNGNPEKPRYNLIGDRTKRLTIAHIKEKPQSHLKPNTKESEVVVCVPLLDFKKLNDWSTLERSYINDTISTINIGRSLLKNYNPRKKTDLPLIKTSKSPESKFPKFYKEDTDILLRKIYEKIKIPNVDTANKSRTTVTRNSLLLLCPSDVMSSPNVILKSYDSYVSGLKGSKKSVEYNQQKVNAVPVRRSSSQFV